MSDLQDLTAQIRAFCQERDWTQFHNHKDVAISLVLEATEVLEHFQWKSPDEVKRVGREKKAELADELADVGVYLLMLADYLEIDLADAIRAKVKKNAEKYPVAKAKGRHTKYDQL